MERKLLGVVFLVLMLFVGIGGKTTSKAAEDNFVGLNTPIDVGDKLYVQHDDSNKDVYDLKKNENGNTIVYELIFPTFTANKVWTTSGEFRDKVEGDTPPQNATAPEDYISVKAGENYFIKTYGVGWHSNWVYYAPVLFLDDEDNVVADMLTNTVSKSKAGVMITVPENATKMHITMYNHQNFTLQRELSLTSEEFDQMIINKDKLEEEINKKYEEYQKDRIVYQKPKKGCITFVNDDTWGDIYEYAELFESKKVPLVLATIPELLIENASTQQETRLDVARRVEKNGGEIIAHNGGVLTREGFADYNQMFFYFVRAKQIFNHYNFDVNGIILAGGVGQEVGAKEEEIWASSFYNYADLYGVPYDQKELALDSVYYHYRTGMGNYNNDLEKLKKTVDATIDDKSWTVFYFHTYNEIQEKVLSELLDYVNEKQAKEELDVVTYKQMYQKYAIRESELKSTKHTYYVSSTGTSKEGTDPSEPMSYEEANKKQFVSGDTILLKRGDTFYGKFNPRIRKVDDKVTRVSSYGDGKLPEIQGYKIVSKEGAWQKHEDGIYKVDLTDTTAFSGLQTTDALSVNIGFLQDKDGNKYFKKEKGLGELKNQYDFFCDTKYLYIKSDENPYKALGELKLATRTNLFLVTSNMKVDHLKICGTGAHGILNGANKVENVLISHNVIEDIGGSYLKGDTRYGNGIEFYDADVENISVKNNIIRNIYDVAFTMQGTTGSGKDVIVEDNVFVNNTQDSEIWETENATGIKSYEFRNNIAIGTGRGWGYEARTDKYVSAHILFWAYGIEDSDIYFHNNIVYDPRRVYFIEQTAGTNVLFKEKNFIKSDYNQYYLATGAAIFRDSYKPEEHEQFVVDYKKDMNSIWQSVDALEIEAKKQKEIVNADDIAALKDIFGVKQETEEDEFTGIGETTPIPTTAPQPTPVPTKEPVAGITKGKTYKVGNGVYLVTKAGKKTGTVTFEKIVNKKSKSLSIPKEVTIKGVKCMVTAISSGACKNCKSLKKLTIGGNVEKIGGKAFYGCKKLTSIQVKTKKLTEKTVEGKAFASIGKKAVIKVPKSKRKAYKKIFKDALSRGGKIK